MELHRITCGHTGLHRAIYTGSHMAIQGYIRLHRKTWGYTGLHMASQG